MTMPEWAREPAELRSPDNFNQLSGVGRRTRPRGVPGHVKSMTNLSPVMCKMLKLSSPVINDKLITNLSSFLPTCRKR